MLSPLALSLGWLMVGASAADLGSSEWALSRPDMREANPFLQDRSARIAMKAAAPVLVWWTAKRLERAKHRNWAKGLKIGATMLWGGAAAWNMRAARGGRR